MLMVLVRDDARGAHLLYMRYMHNPLTFVARAIKTAEECVQGLSMEEFLETVESFANGRSIAQRNRFVDRELFMDHHEEEEEVEVKGGIDVAQESEQREEKVADEENTNADSGKNADATSPSSGQVDDSEDDRMDGRAKEETDEEEEDETDKEEANKDVGDGRDENIIESVRRRRRTPTVS